MPPVPSRIEPEATVPSRRPPVKDVLGLFRVSESRAVRHLGKKMTGNMSKDPMRAISSDASSAYIPKLVQENPTMCVYMISSDELKPVVEGIVKNTATNSTSVWLVRTRPIRCTRPASPCPVPAPAPCS